MYIIFGEKGKWVISFKAESNKNKRYGKYQILKFEVVALVYHARENMKEKGNRNIEVISNYTLLYTFYNLRTEKSKSLISKL